LKWARTAGRGESASGQRSRPRAAAHLTSVRDAAERQLTALLAFSLALALALGCAAPPAPSSAAGLVRLPSEQLAPVAARVEAARGLAFAHAPDGWLVPQPALRALLEREQDRSAPQRELARGAELAASLGLVPRGFDLRAGVLAFQELNAAGFYSPRDDRLYVVEGAASAGALDSDALLVHELTHALQAQHLRDFGALLALRGDDDLAFALTAWLEGEATFIELADAAARSGRPRQTPSELAAQFPSAESISELPRVVAAALLEAYPLGYALVDGLVARGGIAALDTVYANPPLTSEQLLHPERARQPLAELARTPALRGCRVRATNCYGELTVRSWLEALGASRAAAASAAAGWDADRAWLFECGGRSASAWLLAYDDEAEARELERELRARGPQGGEGALALTPSGARLLVSHGLGDAQRARLLALPPPREFRDLGAWLAAHPAARRSARR
jgi:hypothetical protein